MSDPSPEFLRVFRTRRSLVAALLDLSRAQEPLIAENGFPELMEILHSKQHLLTQMQLQNQRESGVWRQWPQVRESLPQHSRTECDQLLQETELALQQLGENERHCTAQLVQRHQATARELQTLSQVAQTSLAYQRSTYSQTRHTLDINQ